MQNRERGIFLVLVCVSFWALIPVVSKLGQSTLDSHQFLFWSCLNSFLILLITASIKGNLSEVARYSLKDHLNLILLGMLGIYIFYLFLYLGYSTTRGMEVLIFQYTWPIWIVLLSIPILKERINGKKLFALFMGFAGVFIVMTQGRFQDITINNPGSIFLVTTGAASFALFSVLSKRVNKDPYVVVTYYFFTACVAAFISMLLFSDFSSPSINEILPILINGSLVNGISYLLWQKALRLTEASTLAPFTFITPILSTIYLLIFFDEPFLLTHVIGLICILSGGLLASIKRGN